MTEDLHSGVAFGRRFFISDSAYDFIMMKDMFKRLGAFFRAYPALFFTSKNPKSAKYLPLATLAYLIVPIDLMPDFIPLLGQLDDVGVIIVLLSIALRAFEQMPDQKKKRKYGDVIDVEVVKD